MSTYNIQFYDKIIKFPEVRYLFYELSEEFRRDLKMSSN